MGREKEEGKRGTRPNEFWRKFNFASVTCKQSGTCTQIESTTQTPSIQHRACAVAAVPEAEVTPQRSGGCDGGCDGGGGGGCFVPRCQRDSALRGCGESSSRSLLSSHLAKGLSPAVRESRVQRFCRSHTGPGLFVGRW